MTSPSAAGRSVPTEEPLATPQVRTDLPLAKVTQMYLAKQDDGGNVGDCVRAVICSLFGFDVTEVPHFAKHGFDDPKGTPDHNVWWHALVGFIDLLEPSYATIVTDEPPPPSDNQDDLYGCYMASGKSPRGEWQHCVVARGGEVIWDPHPSRAGIDGPLECDAYFVRRAALTDRPGLTSPSP